MSKKQVKLLNELSYGKIRNMAQLLTNDDSIDLHWKELAAKYEFYTVDRVHMFMAAKDPAEALLQDLCFRNVPVDDVYSKLRQMGHKQAMSVLADDGRESIGLCVCASLANAHVRAHTHTFSVRALVCKTVGPCYV